MTIWRRRLEYSWEIQCQKQKIEVFMGDPAPGGDDDDSTCPENYIIIDDTDSDPDIAMMTMLMKLEQISWSLQPKNISSIPPHQ